MTVILMSIVALAIESLALLWSSTLANGTSLCRVPQANVQELFLTLPSLTSTSCPAVNLEVLPS